MKIYKRPKAAVMLSLYFDSLDSQSLSVAFLSSVKSRDWSWQKEMSLADLAFSPQRGGRTRGRADGVWCHGVTEAIRISNFKLQIAKCGFPFGASACCLMAVVFCRVSRIISAPEKRYDDGHKSLFSARAKR